MPRRLLLGLIVATLLAPSAPAAAAPPPDVDPRILVVGDSVILGAAGTIGERLEGWDLTFLAQVSLSTVGAVSIIDANRAAIGSVVVIALGYNDGANPSILAGRVDTVMGALVDVPRVIWVNLRGFATWVPAANAVIADATARWANLEVADWASIATPRPDLVAGDGIHLGASGAAAMADLVGSHVDAAAASLAPPPPTTTSTTTTTTTTTSATTTTTRSSATPPGDPGGSQGALGPVAGVALLVAAAIAGIAGVAVVVERRRRVSARA